MSAPRLSLVMPTYNQARYLGRALDSVFAQTFRDFELIVVDDGSSDETPSILNAYRERHAFTIVHQKNRRLPCALNAGFAIARGEYLSWTSSDNIMLPDMLGQLSAALDADPRVGLVYADWAFLDDADNLLGECRTLDYDRHLLLRHNFVHCCFLYRRSCAARTGEYDPEFVYGEDWEYWIRMSRHCRMQRVPRVLYWYRLHQTSMTAEILNGTARRAILSSEFDARVRRQWPLDWLISKFKWQYLTRVRRRDPRSDWRQSIARMQA